MKLLVVWSSMREASGSSRRRRSTCVTSSGSFPGNADLVVEGLVVVEIKAVSRLLELHERQVRSYLKTMGLRAGLLANFNAVLLKNGIRRVVST
jgi:GxxExxY protein